jgi:hypothetical protein
MDRNCVHWLKHDSKFATQFGTNYWQWIIT